MPLRPSGLRPAQLGTGALVVAALAVGGVISRWAPDDNGESTSFERATAVGAPLTVRWAELEVTAVEGGKELGIGPSQNKLSPGVWLVVRYDLTPTVDSRTPAFAGLRTGSGDTLSRGSRNELRCPPTNPGLVTHCVTAFEVAPGDAPGTKLVIGLDQGDQRYDDVVVVDLGVDAADVRGWQARATPITLQPSDGTS